MGRTASKSRVIDTTLRKAVKKIGKGLAISFVISCYAACFLHTATTGYGRSFNPLKHIHCCIVYGIPYMKIFMIFFAISFLTVYLALKQLKDENGKDPLGRMFRMSSKQKSHGESHFETPEEYRDVALIQSPEDAVGTIFGQMDEKGEKLLNFRMDEGNRLNQHIAVIGSSGKGKTYTFSKPYCIQTVKRRESIIITDPDGGLYRDMAGYFKDNNYVVRRLDLSNPTKSDGWDCLKCISRDNPDQAEIDAKMFSKIVISNVTDNPTSIYSTAPQSLLQALILRIVLDTDKRYPEKTIKTVYAELQNTGGEKYLETLFPEKMTGNIKRSRGGYVTFKQASANLQGNLLSNLNSYLEILQSEILCDVLSTDDIDLELPGKQPCAYFCIFPDTHNTYQFIVSLFFSMLFIKLVHYADSKTKDGKLPVPVRFLLEELPSIGIIPNFDRLMSTVRKRRISCAMVCQDLTQYQNLYPKSWQTILGACDTVVSIGVSDLESAKYLSNRCGETTVQLESKRGDAAEALMPVFKDKTVSEGRRKLMTPDEILKMDIDDALIFFETHNPVIVRKYPYKLHPEASKFRTIMLDDIPDLHDRERREELKREEEIRLRRYYRWHPLSKIDRTYADSVAQEEEEDLGKSIKVTTANILNYLAEIVEGEDEIIDGDGFVEERFIIDDPDKTIYLNDEEWIEESFAIEGIEDLKNPEGKKEEIKPVDITDEELQREKSKEMLKGKSFSDPVNYEKKESVKDEDDIEFEDNEEYEKASKEEEASNTEAKEEPKESKESKKSSKTRANYNHPPKKK